MEYAIIIKSIELYPDPMMFDLPIVTPKKDMIDQSWTFQSWAAARNFDCDWSAACAEGLGVQLGQAHVIFFETCGVSKSIQKLNNKLVSVGLDNEKIIYRNQAGISQKLIQRTHSIHPCLIKIRMILGLALSRPR